MVVVYSIAKADPYSFFYNEEEEKNTSVTCTRPYQSSTSSNNTPLAYNAKDGGIPYVLAINVALFLSMIVIFSFARRWAWNYGRLGLLEKSRWVSTVYQPVRNSDSNQRNASSHVSDVRIEGEEGYFTWIWTTIMLKHQDITNTCGPDAGHFLSFTRHLTVLQLIVTILSVAVILPANYSGQLVKEPFARTTVTNLEKDSNVYWLHNIFSVVYTILVIMAMVLFARELRKRQRSESRHTVMITQIPSSVSAEDLQAHFEEAYSDVVDVQFAYDVSKLSKLNRQRVVAVRNCIKYKELSEAKGSPFLIHKGACEDRIPLCCFGDEVEAEPYYERKRQQLTSQCSSCLGHVLRNRRLEVAFVTLADSGAAKRAATDYKLGRKPAASSMSDKVKSGQWSVELAPLPHSLKWSNLSTGTFLWWARFVLINAVLCTVLFFWTTPIVIIGALGKVKPSGVSPSVAESAFVTIWLPTLLLWLLTAVLPVAVSYTTYLENHWTKSNFEQFIMRKTFIFLLLMALLLPALGLASLDSFFTNFHSRDSLFNQLECIFLPNNGGFFISYVTFCAFIGTGIELLRLPQLVSYFLAVMRAKSTQEKDDAKKAVTGEFQFGVEYAWLITIFGMSLVFSITCPLITVFGLCYLVLKYFITKYNLYFALCRSQRLVKINVHHTAVNFVILCAVLLQLTDLFFSLLRLRKLKESHTIFALIMFILTVTYVAASMLFGQLAYLTPFGRRSGVQDDSASILPKGSYVAPVIQENFESTDAKPNVSVTGDDDDAVAAAGRQGDEEDDDDDDALVDGAPQGQGMGRSGYQTFQ